MVGRRLDRAALAAATGMGADRWVLVEMMDGGSSRRKYLQFSREDGEKMSVTVCDESVSSTPTTEPPPPGIV